MKKNICKAAVLTAVAALAQGAQAQSAVTVWGLLDMSLKSVTTGGVSASQVANEGLYNNRLGFRADEDLGGGMKAGAWLEMGLSPDTGTVYSSGKLFHRRSTVSLSGSFGELRIGRDIDPSYYNLALFDPFYTLGVGASLNLVSTLGSGAATLLRTDNAVSYFLPANLGGWYGQLQVAPGEGVPGNRYSGARLGYQQGPWNAAVAYGRTGTATADDFKLANAGVSYDAGVVKLMLSLNQAQYGAKKLATVGLGLTAPLSAAGALRASYVRADASGAGTDANDGRQFALGYLHSLSKRTTLYATISTLANRGAANFRVSAPPDAKAGANSHGVEAGIAHSF